MSWREFWLIQDKVKHFWKIKLSGKSITVVTGRQGSKGRTTTQEFASTEAAAGAQIEAISKTLGKGYREGKEQPDNIWDAIEEGNLAAVRQLMGEHPEWIHALGHYDETPLHVAVRCGQCAMAKLLLDAGAEINARGGEDERTPFAEAVADFSVLVPTDIEMVELLLRYDPDLSIADKRGETPLSWATAKKELGDLLRQHGVTLDRDPVPKLITALREKGMKDVQEQLAANPALLHSPRIADVAQEAITCAGNRARTFVSFLLDHGLDANATSHGQSLLASALGAPQVVRLLLEKGAEVTRLEQGGRTLLLSALYVRADKQIINDLMHFGVKKDLIVQLHLEGAKKVLAEVKRNPAPVRELDDPVDFMNHAIGYQQYFHGPAQACMELVELLLQLGVDPNAHGPTQVAPLRLAVQKANVRLVRKLLEHGANPNPQDAQAGTSVLAHAGFGETTADSMKTIVDLLSARGAQFDPRTHAGWMQVLDAVVLRRARQKKKKK